MPTRQHQKPPPGFCFIEDAKDDDGNHIPGIASRIGISASTYRKWRMAGKGPVTVPLGKRVAARISAVEDYLDGLESNAGPAENPENRPAEPRIPTQRAAA